MIEYKPYQIEDFTGRLEDNDLTVVPDSGRWVRYPAAGERWVLAVMIANKEEEMIRPFSNGAQFGDWETSNCLRCQKQNTCDISDALTGAYFDDGRVSPQIARRMGYEPGVYGWACREVEWTESWKAEWTRKRDAG